MFLQHSCREPLGAKFDAEMAILFGDGGEKAQVGAGGRWWAQEAHRQGFSVGDEGVVSRGLLVGFEGLWAAWAAQRHRTGTHPVPNRGFLGCEIGTFYSLVFVSHSDFGPGLIPSIVDRHPLCPSLPSAATTALLISFAEKDSRSSRRGIRHLSVLLDTTLRPGRDKLQMDVPNPGEWPVDPQEEQEIRKDRIWVDGCFDFAHHGKVTQYPPKVGQLPL